MGEAPRGCLARPGVPGSRRRRRLLARAQAQSTASAYPGSPGSTGGAGPLREACSRLPRARAHGHPRSRPPVRAWIPEDTLCPLRDTTNHTEREVVRRRAAPREERLYGPRRPRPPGYRSCALTGVTALRAPQPWGLA